GRAQKRILLRDQLAPDLLEIDGLDLPGVGCGERDLALGLRVVGEHGHEERFAGEQALARAHERAHQAARLALLRAVAADRLHLQPVFGVHHAARFRNAGLSRIELNANELQIVADDLVIDLVHRGHGASPWRYGFRAQNGSLSAPASRPSRVTTLAAPRRFPLATHAVERR